ncbi:hypothetical protein Xen7305DRAFT_00000280 [Xenococcus sp. PCC 7305]|uniref:hypothetical protein n=1 Tax=Xenococcus sp. PCC 7305 TaxID=102125 RepID=UPI0002ABE579|nr:hypothetical protein [Xenococcus sp. PCC 7305]ELS00328.1 hypothetical protein Xen7305DRAFT_00000280 [Xenococcus sp. PCC 7305]
MQPIKQSQTKITIVVPSVEKAQPSKKPKINPWIFKVISVTVVTLMSWLTPEAAIAIFLIKLLFIFLEWLNKKDAK